MNCDDGKLLLGVPRFDGARGGPGRIEVWEVATGQMWKLDCERFYKLARFPDGGMIAVAVNQSRLLFLDSKTGAEKALGAGVQQQ